MQISKHGTFYVRNGWPTKILDAIQTDPHIFSPNCELAAIDEIGVGRVMIRAMRYWATALGLATENKSQQGISHVLTPLGQIIYNHDPYCINIGSLWLLQHHLAQGQEYATAWYWAFHVFEGGVYTKEEFVAAFDLYLQREGATYATRAIEKEFDCFKNTYVVDQPLSLSQIINENTMPFFAPLRILEYDDRGRLTRRFVQSRDIPADVFFACILMDNQAHLAEEHKQISVEQLLKDRGQVCRCFGLNYTSLIELLQQLENKNRIRLINSYGSQHIEILAGQSVDRVLNEYYNNY